MNARSPRTRPAPLRIDGRTPNLTAAYTELGGITARVSR